MVVLGMLKTLKLQGYRPSSKHSWREVTKCNYLYCDYENMSDHEDYDCHCRFWLDYTLYEIIVVRDHSIGWMNLDFTAMPNSWNIINFFLG